MDFVAELPLKDSNENMMVITDRLGKSVIWDRETVTKKFDHVRPW
jgi:hypothetical protein